MNNIIKFKKRSQKKGKLIIVSGVFGALVLIVGIIFFLQVSKNDSPDNNNNLPVIDTAAMDKNNDYEISPGVDPDISITDDAIIDESIDNSSDGLAEDITVPPVIVAPVDDTNDPQEVLTDGVKVDMGKISSADQKANASNNKDSSNNTDSNNKKDTSSKTDGTSKKDTSKSDVVTFGIDVAKWQGVIDWKQVKKSGVEFAMIRVGYRTLVDGTIYEDPYAEYNLQQAEANKIKIGVYFFSTAITKKEAIEEAKWVTKLISKYSITYPVVYNCEGFTNPNNRQYKLSIDTRTDIAIAFLDYVKGEGYEPMFYAAKNELEKNAQWNIDKLSSKYKIWVAEYPDRGYTSDSRSTYSGEHAMWQYTNKGEVKGIKGAVDINIAYFGYDKIAKAKKDTTKEQVDADPYALIKFTEVNETVTAKEVTNLRTVPSSADPDTVVSVLKNGETAARIGIGDNGWSKLEYGGKTVYAVSSYLTTDLTAKTPTPSPTLAPTPTGPSFTKVNEQVTAKDKTNLRSEPSTKSDDTIVEVLNNGDIATRTGISDNGWSRVEYNGKTLYAVSKYLTTDVNYKQGNTPSVDNPEAGIKFTAVNENVTAKDVTNLRSVPSTASPDTIVTALHKGDIAVRTGIGHNGWSRVEYNGQILYAVSNYLVVVEDE